MNERQPEAVERPPWNPASGEPKPEIYLYPPTQRPGLRIRTRGAWRYAKVQARETRADGRVAYHVTVRLPGPDGIVGTCDRAYWWNPKTMRPARDA